MLHTLSLSRDDDTHTRTARPPQTLKLFRSSGRESEREKYLFLGF